MCLRVLVGMLNCAPVHVLGGILVEMAFARFGRKYPARLRRVSIFCYWDWTRCHAMSEGGNTRSTAIMWLLESTGAAAARNLAKHLGTGRRYSRHGLFGVRWLAYWGLAS